MFLNGSGDSPRRIEREGLIGWLKVKSSHPLLFEKDVSFLLGFPTTWLKREETYA